MEKRLFWCCRLIELMVLITGLSYSCFLLFTFAFPSPSDWAQSSDLLYFGQIEANLIKAEAWKSILVNYVSNLVSLRSQWEPTQSSLSKGSERQTYRREPRCPNWSNPEPVTASHVREPIQDQQIVHRPQPQQLTRVSPAEPTTKQLIYRHVNNDEGLLN